MCLADILKCADCHYVQGLKNATAIPVRRHQELNGPDLVPSFSYCLQNMHRLSRDGCALWMWHQPRNLGGWDLSAVWPAINCATSVKYVLSIFLLSFYFRENSLSFLKSSRIFKVLFSSSKRQFLMV